MNTFFLNKATSTHIGLVSLVAFFIVLVLYIESINGLQKELNVIHTPACHSETMPWKLPFRLFQ